MSNQYYPWNDLTYRISKLSSNANRPRRYFGGGGGHSSSEQSEPKGYSYEKVDDSKDVGLRFVLGVCVVSCAFFLCLFLGSYGAMVLADSISRETNPGAYHRVPR